jgi:hypothetical protein
MAAPDAASPHRYSNTRIDDNDLARKTTPDRGPGTKNESQRFIHRQPQTLAQTVDWLFMDKA